MRPSAIDLIQDEKNVYYPAKKNAAYAQSVSVQKPTWPVHRRKHWRARAQGEHPYPFVLAVNKSPSVYFLSRALDGL